MSFILVMCCKEATHLLPYHTTVILYSCIVYMSKAFEWEMQNFNVIAVNSGFCVIKSHLIL